VVAALGIGAVASAASDRPAKQFRFEREIAAPRSEVWRLLTDFDHYSDWNPFITDGSGRLGLGETLRLRYEPPDGDSSVRQPEIQILNPKRKMRWRSRHLHLPGVLDREQEFKLISLGPHRMRLIVHGRWEGLLAPFGNVDATERGYLMMVDALERRAERADAELR
jgi:hypothetical protein